MRRRLLLSTVLWLLIVVVVIGLVFRFGADPVIALVGLILSMLALSPFAQPIRKWWAVPSTSTDAETEEAWTALRQALKKQWEAEAERRKLARDEDQMAVRWELVGGRDAGARSTGGLASEGTVRQLIDHYRADPQPLIIIGEGGSGKTAACVQLMVELLRQVNQRRIPVSLQLSSWDPDEETFAGWLRRRLEEDYRFLTSPDYGGTAVQRLIETGRILPILEELDELPADSRQKVLQIVREAKVFSEPFVLTCRVAEFEQARGRAPVRARLIRMLPISPADTIAYLEEEFRNDKERWLPVLDEIRDSPHGVVATTLARPLMLFLARTAYYNPDSSPSDLLDRDLYLDRAAIERHLLDVFVPTVFADSARRGGTRTAPEDAGRYLAYLSRQMPHMREGAERTTTDLDWWQLIHVVPRAVTVLVPVVLGVIACCGLGLLFFGPVGKAGLGLLVGLAVGLVCGLGFGFARMQPPRQFALRALTRGSLRPKAILPDIALALVGFFIGGFITALVSDLSYGIIAGLVFGTVFAFGRRFTEPTAPTEAITPLRSLRQDRAAVAGAWLLGAAAGAVVGSLTALTSRVIADNLVFALSDGGRALLGAGIGIVLGGAALGMMVQATSAWGRWLTARGWLAATGATPWRLLAFLETAHKLGVLRLSGASYQFRNELLQQRLAATTAIPQRL